VTDTTPHTLAIDPPPADDAEQTTDPSARPVYTLPLPRQQGDILMHPPTEAQWAVFARMLQQIDVNADWSVREPDAREKKLIQRAVGNTLAILDDCLATEAAKEQADRMLVDGRLLPEEAMQLLVAVAREHGMFLDAKTAPKNGPVQLRR
jgi:hypothetical protein